MLNNAKKFFGECWHDYVDLCAQEYDLKYRFTVR